MIADYVGIVDQRFVLETLMLSPKYCAKLNAGYISSTMQFVQALKRLGYIRREISREEIFNTALIDAVHPSEDHYGDGLRSQ